MLHVHQTFVLGPYASLLEFATAVRRELKPRDMIDLQSFIWVQGSDEFEE